MDKKLLDILSEELEFMKNDKFDSELENTELLHDYFSEMQTKVGSVYPAEEVIEALLELPEIQTRLMFPTSEGGNLLRTEGGGSEDGIIAEDDNDLSLCLSILNLEERAHNTEAFLLGCFTKSLDETERKDIKEENSDTTITIITYKESDEYLKFIEKVFFTLPEGFEIYQYPEFNDPTDLDSFRNICQVISANKIAGSKKVSEYLKEVKDYVFSLNREEKIPYISEYEKDIRVAIFNAAYRVKMNKDLESYQELKELLKMFALEVFKKSSAEEGEVKGNIDHTVCQP